MTRIWITQWAFDYREAGVIAVDVPGELVPEGDRCLKLPRELLKPWHRPGIFRTVEVYAHWYRSEADAKVALKREIERRIRKAKRELAEAQKHLAAFKANGLPMAQTIAEKKAARRARVTP